ncbi:MAG: DUF4340 domain-containing protein [Gammaproteobacteria bacterium]
MMSQRRVYGLLIAAVVVIALAVWISASRKHGDGASSLAGHPVLEGLKPALNDVTEIRVAKGDGTHVTLRKGASDWQVGEREYSADSGKVRKLLLDLGSLQVVEEKTRDPASYSRIGVEDVNSPKATGTKVEAVTAKKVYALIVGKPAGMKSTYVRAAGAPVSMLASPSIAADADPKRWLANTLVDIPEARIKDVAVMPASGPAYSITREKKEQTDFTVTNIPKGRELSSPGMGAAAAGDLASVTLDDVRHAPAAEATAAANAAGKPAGPATASASVGKAAAPAANAASGKAAGKAGASGAAAKASAQSATFRTFDGLELQVDGVKDGDRHYIAIAPRSTAKETATEAQELEARLKGWQFEIPAYKYDAFFRPLEELLKQPEPRPDAKGAKKPAAGSPLQMGAPGRPNFPSSPMPGSHP